jgi:ribosomal-protein-alanine N-acetyltransferase
MAVKFSLRDFRPDDFETLWRIDQQCFAPGISYSRADLAAYLRRPGAFAMVAESSETTNSGARAGGPNHEKPSGMAGFVVAEASNRGTGHVITIDVLPELQRLGVGSQLLGAAELRLRAAHCQAVFLETAVDNRAALSFYKAHEYSVIKTIPRYYSDGVDALVLKKELKKDLLSPPGPAKLRP